MKIFYIAKVVLFSVLYLIVAKAGILLALDGGFATPVWLGSGTALLFLLYNGVKIWPAITLGSFLVNWLSGGTNGFALVVGIGNTLEPLVAYYILNYFNAGQFLFLKLKSVVTFLLASAFGSVISALIGAFAYWLFLSKNIHLPKIIGTWWLGNFTSFLLLVPFVFLFRKASLSEFKNIHFYLSIPLTVLACAATFFTDTGSTILPTILLYALFIFPIFAALTQNRISALIHVLIVEFFAVIATYNGKGPFVYAELNTSLVIIQSFVSILTIVTLIIAVGVKEKELIKDDLNLLLSEKEMLLSEIHHRIKNNLSIVSSLLYLQNETIGDPEIRDKLNQTGLRIKAIALVHEKLYKKKSDINTVEFSDYIETLAKMISRIYDCNVNLILHLEKIDLPIEKAQPLGLIISEIITNSFKHAFSEANGEIEIKFQLKDGEYYLMIRDNGKGIPDQQNSADSLGTTLIKSLAEQIDAKYDIHTRGGTAYEFSFK